MTRSMQTIAALAVAASLSGCATIVDGSTQSLTFNSTPQGAQVLSADLPIGVTPLTVNLDRKSVQTVVFRKEGFRDESLEIRAGFNPWFFGNICTGGLMGSTTDTASGAVNEYDPSAFHVTLVPNEVPEAAPPTSLRMDPARERVFEFALASHGELARDIAKGSGDYLDALLEMYGSTAFDRDTHIAMLKKRVAELVDPVQFAHAVAMDATGI